MDVKLQWHGGLAFSAEASSGHTIRLDGHPEGGAPTSGPTPMETLLVSTAACTAMDVISILQKKRQDVTGYRLEVRGERGPEGEHPRPFRRIVVRHIVEGVDLDPTALARAVELSDTKYCSVSATLRQGPEIVMEWATEPKPAAPVL